MPNNKANYRRNRRIARAHHGVQESLKQSYGVPARFGTITPGFSIHLASEADIEASIPVPIPVPIPAPVEIKFYLTPTWWERFFHV